MRALTSVLLVAVAVLVVLLGWQMRWTSDDAFINFRIVENILNGDGPVYNQVSASSPAPHPCG